MPNLVDFIPRACRTLIVLLLAAAPLFGSSSLTRAETSDSLSQETSQPRGAGEIFVEDFKESVQDGAAILFSPLHFGTRAWISTGAVAAGTVGLIELSDQPTRDFFTSHHSNTGDQLASYGNFFGTGVIEIGSAVGLYGVGIAANEPKIRLMGRHIVQALAYSGVVTTVLKSVFGRARPYLNLGPHDFKGPTIANDWNSMPSGHVTVATAACSSLAEDIGNTWASIGLYSAAAVTVFARMYSDKHWSSEVFLGGVIGTACGYWTVHLHDASTTSEQVRGSTSEDGRTIPTRTQQSLRIMPTVNGLLLSYQF